MMRGYYSPHKGRVWLMLVKSLWLSWGLRAGGGRALWLSRVRHVNVRRGVAARTRPKLNPAQRGLRAWQSCRSRPVTGAAAWLQLHACWRCLPPGPSPAIQLGHVAAERRDKAPCVRLESRHRAVAVLLLSGLRAATQRHAARHACSGDLRVHPHLEDARVGVAWCGDSRGEECVCQRMRAFRGGQQRRCRHGERRCRAALQRAARRRGSGGNHG